MYDILHIPAIRLNRMVFLSSFLLSMLLLPGWTGMAQTIQHKEIFKNKEVTLALEIISKERRGQLVKDTTFILKGPNARTRTTSVVKAFEGDASQFRIFFADMIRFTNQHPKELHIQQRYKSYTFLLKDKKKYLLIQNTWGDAIGLKFTTIPKISKQLKRTL